MTSWGMVTNCVGLMAMDGKKWLNPIASRMPESTVIKDVGRRETLSERYFFQRMRINSVIKEIVTAPAEV